MKSARSLRGFTLIEIMVVIGIIATLTTAVVIFASRSSEISRNTQRQADLTLLKNAVESYKQRWGRYPEGCKGPGNWSGERGGLHECPAASTQYIVGQTSPLIRFAPNFISVLPRDPRRTSSTQGGYVYTTNADGTVYKIMAMGTVEGAPVTDTHPFKSCDIKDVNSNDIRDNGYCGSFDPGGIKQTRFHTSQPCNSTHPQFMTSYAVWGGIAPLQGTVADSFPVDCFSGWCINLNPPSATDDPLDTFITTPGGVTSSAATPIVVIRNTLRVRALNNTTQIICK